jgi:hypothetical protein
MYKRITEGQELTVTGLNLYSGSTQVFFNTTGNEVGVLSDSYNVDHTQVSVNVPAGLPDLNDVIVYNGINYFTGDSKYRFFAAPSISGLSDNSVKWLEDTLVSGKYLAETTGVSIGGSGCDFYVEGQNRVVLTVAADIPSGEQTLQLDTKGGVATTSMTIEEPNLGGELSAYSYNSGLAFGESGVIENGKATHRVNRIIVSGYSEQLFIDSLDIASHGTTGLSFRVPNKAVNGYPVILQNQTGYYSSGSYYPTIISQHTTSQNLKVISPYVSSVSTGAAKYQDSVTVNGSQVENCKILISGYNAGYIEATTTSTGLNTNVFSMPRGAMRSKIIASGYTGDTSSTSTSISYIYPIPTITGVSTSSWVIGNQVEIEAINAAEARPLVVINGTDKLRGGGAYTVNGKFIVGLPSDFSSSRVNHFGSTSIDSSSLSDSLTTGVSKITATINAEMIGNGSPFLVSKYEGGYLNDLSTFVGQIINIPNYNTVTVSGKQPTIMGLSSNRSVKTDTISISGNYFMTAYQLTLSDGSETKTLSTGSFNEPTEAGHDFIEVIASGSANNYEAPHKISINLSDFNFSGTNGAFTLQTITP